jgi:hypothetical protein
VKFAQFVKEFKKGKETPKTLFFPFSLFGPVAQPYSAHFSRSGPLPPLFYFFSAGPLAYLSREAKLGLCFFSAAQ